MSLQPRMRLVILGICLFIVFESMKCKKLDGYKFPVYSTPFCPRNESEWNKRSSALNCNKTNGYTCLPNEKFTELLEFCYRQPFILIEKGFCLYLERKDSYVYSYSCHNFTDGCHNTSYQSIRVFEYPACISIGNGCFLAEISCKSSPNSTYQSDTTDNGKDDSFWIVILMGILVLVFCFSFCVLYFYHKKEFAGCKRSTDIDISSELTGREALITKTKKANEVSPNNGDEIKQKEKNLRELLTYLVCILKQELDVNDLKEKTLIHSKSINEYFSEPLFEDLKSLKDLSDYSQLDMSLVFALLQNFCEGIKPPSRGWDCEPPDDETHVGADIERIRSMWNKYCDDNFEFNLKHLDDVYNRIKQKYGTEVLHGDNGFGKSPSKKQENTEGFEIWKTKIRSIKLNPDCIVKRGVVITENITTALKILESRNVVILKGVIGCGKTHALKAIQNYFQKLGWETEWMETDNLRTNTFKDISTKKSTMIRLCDNLFGKFGCSVFLHDVFISTEDFLKSIDSVKQDSKVVIGIHTHVYDEVKQFFNPTFLNQKHITVEMGSLSEAETVLIYKNQLEKGHCKMDSNCRSKDVVFQPLLDKLSQNHGHIGGPFLSLMYCFQHDLFSDNPVQTLVDYFVRMKKDSPGRFYCLVYLMCVQEHALEAEPKEWAGKINAKITKQNLINLANTSELLQVENTKATLAHELLTTALFKSAIKSPKLFLPVLQVCKIDVVLQILRPTGSTSVDLYFEYEYDTSIHSRDILKMGAYRLANFYQQKDVHHPMMKVQIFKEKFYEYLRRKPGDLSFIN